MADDQTRTSPKDRGAPVPQAPEDELSLTSAEADQPEESGEGGHGAAPAVEEPAAEAGDEEPAAEAGDEEPAPEPADGEEPAAEAGDEEPAAEAGDEEPAAEAGDEEPAAEPADEEPAAEPADEEPAAEPADEEPAAEPADEEPAAEAADEEPAAEAGAGESGPEPPGPGEQQGQQPSAVPGAEPSQTPETEQRPPGSSPGRDRLMAALRRPTSRGQLIAAILLAIVGFASVVQVQSTEADDDYEGARQEDLVQLLNSLAAASQRAENEIAQLEQTRNSLRNDTKSRQTALEQARQLANVYGILAGTLPAVGPGVIVTVQDPNNAVGTDQLLNGIEELRDAGAEAIEINDTVRVVAQTSLADGENGVVVDGQQLTPPYTIEAIGDSHTLAQALDFTGGFVDVIEGETVGGNVVVNEVSNVEVATLHQPEEPEYAEPVEPE